MAGGGHFLSIPSPPYGNHIITRFEFLTVGDMNSFINEQSGILAPDKCPITLSAVDNGSIAQVGSAAPYDFYILADHSVPTWVPWKSGAAPVYFGAGSLATSATTRYLYPNYSDKLAEVNPANELRITKGGTLRNLRVVHNVLGGGAVVITYTVLVNGAPTGLVVGLSAGSALGADLATNVGVVSGDLVSVRATKAGTLTSSPENIHVSMEIS